MCSVSACPLSMLEKQGWHARPWERGLLQTKHPLFHVWRGRLGGGAEQMQDEPSEWEILHFGNFLWALSPFKLLRLLLLVFILFIYCPSCCKPAMSWMVIYRISLATQKYLSLADKRSNAACCNVYKHLVSESKSPTVTSDSCFAHGLEIFSRAPCFLSSSAWTLRPYRSCFYIL